jgi:hypothetical protein
MGQLTGIVKGNFPPLDSQSIENRPELVFHGFVGGRRPTVALDEQEAFRILLPVRFVLGQDRGQCGWESDRHRASLTLYGLSFPVPRRAANVDVLVIEVDIASLELESESFPSAHPGHGERNASTSFGMLHSYIV